MGDRYAVVVVYRDDGTAETKRVTTSADEAWSLANRLRKDSNVVIVVGL
jgi:hypothetical protein